MNITFISFQQVGYRAFLALFVTPHRTLYLVSTSQKVSHEILLRAKKICTWPILMGLMGVWSSTFNYLKNKFRFIKSRMTLIKHIIVSNNCLTALTVSQGVSNTEFLSENPGIWPNLVQMVSISLKVTDIQNDPQMVPLGATRGHSFFYYMKIEGSKPAIYE